MRFWLHPALECEKERKFPQSPTAEGERWASGLLALAEFCHLTPSLAAERRGRVSGLGGHDATSREFWKALGTYPLPLGAEGGGAGGTVV